MRILKKRVKITEGNLRRAERWPSGLRQQFAKLRGPKRPLMGSNPILSALGGFQNGAG